jgi:hypothetical protein
LVNVAAGAKMRSLIKAVRHRPGRTGIPRSAAFGIREPAEPAAFMLF